MHTKRIKLGQHKFGNELLRLTQLTSLRAAQVHKERNIRTMVVFPAPDGPIIDVTWPAAAVPETFFRISMV